MSFLKSVIDVDFWTALLIETLANAAPSTQLANRIAEPYRGLPFARYLHASRSHRPRRLSAPIDVDHAKLWRYRQGLGQITFEQDDSPFFAALSLDIRLIIYELVLGRDVLHIDTREPGGRLACYVCRHPQFIDDRSAHAQCFESSSSNSAVKNLLGLLITCRRAYSEAISVLYSTNTFEFQRMSTAFRFLRIATPPQRLGSIRHFRLYMRMPRHPLLNARTKRDWQELFAFFSLEMPGLQKLYLELDFLEPVSEEILRSCDRSGAEWTLPMLDMALTAWQRNGCCTEIVVGCVKHDVVQVDSEVRQGVRTPPEHAMQQAADNGLDLDTTVASELHRQIRCSLGPPV